MAEPRTAKRMRFTASTLEGLREELNRWAEEMSEQFETETIVTKGVQFIPVRGPVKKAEATLGLLYIREREYDLPTNNLLVLVVPSSALTKALMDVGTGGTFAVDADGEAAAGGLHD